jgi:nucleoside-diphosphate-sugar epimerase
MESQHLVLGATGSMGYAYVAELLANNIRVTALVRNIRKAEQLFNRNELLELVEGDVNDFSLLQKTARHKNVIFYGINYPYQEWATRMMPTTDLVIKVALENNATILFPGNIYAYGNFPEPIKEDSIPLLTTAKGKLRWRVIHQLELATQQGDCKVIVLRLPDFYGPNVTNGLIRPIFGNAAKGKPVEWLLRPDIAHQFVYTADAAKVFYQLEQETDLPDMATFNFAGITVPSINALAEVISQVAGNSAKVKVTPKWLLNIVALFLPVVKELKENFYQFENTIVLNDDKLRALYPELTLTPLEESIRLTVDWFKAKLK